MDESGRRAKESEAARERLRQDLQDVGRNLPDGFHGVEGADVGAVTRHDADDAATPAVDAAMDTEGAPPQDAGGKRPRRASRAGKH